MATTEHKAVIAIAAPEAAETAELKLAKELHGVRALVYRLIHEIAEKQAVCVSQSASVPFPRWTCPTHEAVDAARAASSGVYVTSETPCVRSLLVLQPGKEDGYVVGRTFSVNRVSLTRECIPTKGPTVVEIGITKACTYLFDVLCADGKEVVTAPASARLAMLPDVYKSLAALSCLGTFVVKPYQACSKTKCFECKYDAKTPNLLHHDGTAFPFTGQLLVIPGSSTYSMPRSTTLVWRVPVTSRRGVYVAYAPRSGMRPGSLSVLAAPRSGTLAPFSTTGFRGLAPASLDELEAKMREAAERGGAKTLGSAFLIECDVQKQGENWRYVRSLLHADTPMDLECFWNMLSSFQHPWAPGKNI